jgi:hypothetical protein
MNPNGRTARVESAHMPAKDPAQRVLIARLAAYSKWANCANPEAAMQATRQGFLARFERQVDPTGVLCPSERLRRAEAAMKAHMMTLALRSAQARKRTSRG